MKTILRYSNENHQVRRVQNAKRANRLKDLSFEAQTQKKLSEKPDGQQSLSVTSQIRYSTIEGTDRQSMEQEATSTADGILEDNETGVKLSKISKKVLDVDDVLFNELIFKATNSADLQQ